MPFHPEICGKVKPRIAIISRATCRFQLGVDQSVGSEFSVEDFSCLSRIDRQ